MNMEDQTTRPRPPGAPAGHLHTGHAGERERTELDAGRYADKVAASDPAAAALGTDDEAAGQPSGADASRRPPPEGLATGGIKAGPQPSGREWRIVLPVLSVVLLLGVAWAAVAWGTVR